jgi:hypothetical protein
VAARERDDLNEDPIVVRLRKVRTFPSGPGPTSTNVFRESLRLLIRLEEQVTTAFESAVLYGLLFRPACCLLYHKKHNVFRLRVNSGRLAINQLKNIADCDG